LIHFEKTGSASATRLQLGHLQCRDTAEVILSSDAVLPMQLFENSVNAADEPFLRIESATAFQDLDRCKTVTIRMREMYILYKPATMALCMEFHRHLCCERKSIVAKRQTTVSFGGNSSARADEQSTSRQAKVAAPQSSSLVCTFELRKVHITMTSCAKHLCDLTLKQLAMVVSMNDNRLMNASLSLEEIGLRDLKKDSYKTHEQLIMCVKLSGASTTCTVLTLEISIHRDDDAIAACSPDAYSVAGALQPLQLVIPPMLLQELILVASEFGDSTSIHPQLGAKTATTAGAGTSMAALRRKIIRSCALRAELLNVVIPQSPHGPNQVEICIGSVSLNAIDSIAAVPLASSLGDGLEDGSWALWHANFGPEHFRLHIDGVSIRFHRTRTLIPLHEDDSNKSSDALFDLGRSSIYVSGGVDFQQTASEVVVSTISVAIDKPRLSLLLDTLDHLRCIRWIDVAKDDCAKAESVGSGLHTQSSSPASRSNQQQEPTQRQVLHKLRLGIGCFSVRVGSQLDVDDEPTATLRLTQLSAAAILPGAKRGSANVCFERFEVKVLERPLLACTMPDDECALRPVKGVPRPSLQPDRSAFVAKGRYISIGPTPSLTVDLKLQHVSVYTTPSVLEAITALSSEMHSARAQRLASLGLAYGVRLVGLKPFRAFTAANTGTHTHTCACSHMHQEP
jgi:hypothetical protein